jgi:hypothetical protein
LTQLEPAQLDAVDQPCVRFHLLEQEASRLPEPHPCVSEPLGTDSFRTGSFLRRREQTEDDGMDVHGPALKNFVVPLHRRGEVLLFHVDVLPGGKRLLGVKGADFEALCPGR